MVEFRIRKAVQGDAPSIRQLVRAERLNPLGLDWRRFVVAVRGTGEIIGCGQIKLHSNTSGSKTRELASIVVKPSWRRRGVASMVIDNLLATHPPPIYLTCRGSLESFYNRFGFQVTSGSNLPPYFRRISRLMSLLRRMRLVKEGILVMVRF